MFVRLVLVAVLLQMASAEIGTAKTSEAGHIRHKRFLSSLFGCGGGGGCGGGCGGGGGGCGGYYGGESYGGCGGGYPGYGCGGGGYYQQQIPYQTNTWGGYPIGGQQFASYYPSGGYVSAPQPAYIAQTPIVGQQTQVVATPQVISVPATADAYGTAISG